MSLRSIHGRKIKMQALKLRLQTLLRTEIFWFAAIFCITFAAFSPALTFRELISDDTFYYLNMRAIALSLKNCFAPVLGLHTPLCGLSLYLDFLIGGENNFLFVAHLTNILLHAVSAMLFFLLLRNLKWGKTVLPPAWAGMTALIFALHPQRVESVVWLAERKDCLAMVLGLASLLFFIRSFRKNSISIVSPLLLLLSIGAKPMWIFFFVPAAAFIWLERRKFELKIFLKFLFPSASICLLFLLWYFFGIRHSGFQSAGHVSCLFQLETILYNYGNYFLRTFLPGNLFPVYPFYDPQYAPRWMALLPLMLLLTPLLARKENCRSAIFFGVLPLLVCFAVTLAPVAGFVRIGNTDFADRYSYLPSIFLLTGSAFLLFIHLPSTTTLGSWMPVLSVLYCGGLLWQTEKYLPAWKNEQTKIERSMQLPVPNMIEAQLAITYHLSKGEFEQAEKICKEKMPECEIYPRQFNQNIRLFKTAFEGVLLFKKGRWDEGMLFLEKVYSSPHRHMLVNFPFHFKQQVLTLGAAYHLYRKRNPAAAASLYRYCALTAEKYSKQSQYFYNGLASLIEGKLPEAEKNFLAAHALDPKDKNTLFNLQHVQKLLKQQK